MAQIESTVRITAPAEVVFAFFVPQRMPYWYGSEMHACFEVQGGASDFAVSQKVRISGQVGKREVSHTAVVMALRDARFFEWRFEDRYGVKGKERWDLAGSEPSRPDGAPITTVTMRSEYTMPGIFGKVMDWLVTRHAVTRRNRDYLERLRRYAEHGEVE